MKHLIRGPVTSAANTAHAMRIGRAPVALAFVLSLLVLLPVLAAAAIEPVVVYQPVAGGNYKMYVPATRQVIDLAGTSKMRAAIIGDVNGDGLEDEMVYANAATGGLGYYRISGDGQWRSTNDRAIPYVHSDAIPLAVVRTGGTGTTGRIVYKSASAGRAYHIMPSGAYRTAFTVMMDRAYAVDVSARGYKGDLVWWRQGVGMRWRQGLTGSDRNAPYSFLIPLGGGRVMPDQPNRTITFYAEGYGTYVCDGSYNVSWMHMSVWPWCVNEGSMVVGDIDKDGWNELVMCSSSTGSLQWYKVPRSTSQYDPNAMFTESNVRPGWTLRGVAQVDIVSASVPSVAKIADLRSLADGTTIQLAAKPRTKLVRELDSSLKPVTTGYYVQETDRTAGIRVVGAANVAEGQLVSVKGTLGTLNGERVITALEHAATSQTSVIAPLATNITALYGTTPMTGLLAKVAGSITASNTTGGFFTLYDGSQKPIKVYCPGFTITSGSVAVTGCVGAEKDSTNTVVPVLRLESASDVSSTEPPAPPPVAAKYSAWIRTGLDKVLKADPAQSLTTANIRAARNEYEAFQIVLRAGSTSISSVSVSASNIVSANGSIPASNVTVYVPHYVNLPAAGKEYPDALPPYRSPFNLAAGQTQPLWVDVYVPKNVPAGDYNGTITIADASGAKTDVQYVLRVYNFTLPDAHKTATSFGLWPKYIASKHGVSIGSTQYKSLHKKYYELMLEHGVSTFYDQPVYPYPDALFTDEGKQYLTDPRVTAFWVPYYSNNLSLVKKVLDRMRELGVHSKHYFYHHDEPGTQTQYTELQNMCSKVKSIDSGAKIVIPFWNQPTWTTKSPYELLSGYINIWCPITDYWIRYPGQTSQLDARRQAGDTVWSYVASGPSLPYANYHINYASLEHRIMTWQNYIYRATGLLYWCVNCWEFVSDPWTDQDTVKAGIAAYGGGSLLYPGNKVGIDGPVGSIRLKVLRDALEDYDYLWLLEQKVGRSGVLPYVQRLTTNWHTYTKDKTLFDSVRNDIARAIEQ